MEGRYKVVQKARFGKKYYTDCLAVAVSYIDHINHKFKGSYVKDMKTNKIVYRGDR